MLNYIYNIFRFISWRSLFIKPARTILTTLGVAFGIALFVAIGLINSSVLKSFSESIDAVAGKAEIMVSAGETGFSESYVDKIAAIQGVKHIVPIVENNGYLVGGNKDPLVILGVDLLKEQAVRTYKTTEEEGIDDPLGFLNQPDSIILTKAFAKKHNLDLDDELNLATADGQKTFTVRGLLSPEGPAKAYGGALAIMDIDGARFTFAKQGKVDRLDIVPASGTDVSKLIKTLKEALGGGFFVERPESRSESMERLVHSYQLMLNFFGTMALFVGLFLIANSMGMAVAERKKEIGSLRSMGATKKSILFLFIFEALVMGAVGSFIGAWFGLGLAEVMLDLVTRSMSNQFFTNIAIEKLDFGLMDIIRAVVIGSVAAVFASFLPAFKATKISPLEAMRKTATIDSTDKSSQKIIFKFGPLLGIGILAYLWISSYFGFGNYSPFFGYFEHFCSVLGIVFLGPALVSLAIVTFSRLMQKFGRGSIVFRLAQDNLLRNPIRTGTNVMSLLVGLILVILIASVHVSFKRTISAWFSTMLKADIVVSSNGNLVTYKLQPLHESIGDELNEKIEGLRKNENGYGVWAMRFLQIKYKGKTIAIKASDKPHKDDYGQIVSTDIDFKEAAVLLYENAEKTVLVSETFALHFREKTGNTIQVATPSGMIDFKIGGIVKDFGSSEGVLYMDRKVYKELWRDPLVSVFSLKVLPKYDPRLIQEEINSKFGGSKNMIAVLNSELRVLLTKTVDRSFTFTIAVELAALLVALLGLLNTLLVTIMERTRELGVLRAVGMSRLQLKRMIRLEAIIQGGLGALVAVCFGTWVGYLWVTYSLSIVLGWVIDFYFPWKSIGITFIAGVLVAVIAGIYPARKASKKAIAEALEYE